LPKARVSKSQERFCCIEHHNEWQGRNKTSHICKICGKVFQWSLSRSNSGKYNITYCSLECRNSDPERAALLRRMNAKQLTMHPNNLERATYAILDAIGMAYEPQYLVGGRFCVDAFVPSLSLVIQFDGDYWHGHPDKFPILDERQRKRRRLDASQDAYMTSCGYQVIRIWETDIKKHPEQVTALLRGTLVRL
jgi:very-short-patch-repair endonuclease